VKPFDLAQDKLMPSIRFDIISIGTLSRNRIWGETQPVRTAHATTTLIRSQKRVILVDPGLPGAALVARLYERTGLRPENVDAIFLTNYRPSHRAGLGVFTQAKWLIFEPEQQAASQHLRRLIEQAPDEDIDRKMLVQELELLERMTPADDSLADQVDLYPLTGYTPGTCGLVIKLPTATVMLAGDAVPTQDHFLAGQVLPDSYDIGAAQEAMREVYEIADLIIPGHDNVFLNPRAAGM
jgi:glyoxylase-like metal-dependent hydrolase (beta-lactamase superfamily II)